MEDFEQAARFEGGKRMKERNSRYMREGVIASMTMNNYQQA
ncbi:MAG TPA: hypothetical protein VFK25_06345 [Candidatus Binatia bacterium]|nr:hypothetical protein [Candidatus Binatia bacterium]